MASPGHRSLPLHQEVQLLSTAGHTGEEGGDDGLDAHGQCVCESRLHVICDEHVVRPV